MFILDQRLISLANPSRVSFTVHTKGFDEFPLPFFIALKAGVGNYSGSRATFDINKVSSGQYFNCKAKTKLLNYASLIFEAVRMMSKTNIKF